MATAPRRRYVASSAKQRKHCPHDGRKRACIVSDGEKLIGRCTPGITTAAAQALLDEGIDYAGRSRRSPHPDRVFNVRDGVPYRAQHSGRGEYHGFPVHPKELEEIPDICEQLRARARTAGDLEHFEAWLAGAWASDATAED